jgi:hypothetical protein
MTETKDPVAEHAHDRTTSAKNSKILCFKRQMNYLYAVEFCMGVYIIFCIIISATSHTGGWIK